LQPKVPLSQIGEQVNSLTRKLGDKHFLQVLTSGHISQPLTKHLSHLPSTSIVPFGQGLAIHSFSYKTKPTSHLLQIWPSEEQVRHSLTLQGEHFPVFSQNLSGHSTTQFPSNKYKPEGHTVQCPKSVAKHSRQLFVHSIHLFPSCDLTNPDPHSLTQESFFNNNPSAHS
jgi:hypothetical protein